MLRTHVGAGSRATLVTEGAAERSWRDLPGSFLLAWHELELSHMTTPVQGALGNAVQCATQEWSLDVLSCSALLSVGTYSISLPQRFLSFEVLLEWDSSRKHALTSYS